jgi:hypothetical protein
VLKSPSVMAAGVKVESGMAVVQRSGVKRVARS